MSNLWPVRARFRDADVRVHFESLITILSTHGLLLGEKLLQLAQILADQVGPIARSFSRAL